jgi:hypothetical protein
MIKVGTNVVITDNSGATHGRVFTILGGTRHRTAYVGDVVVLSIKQAEPRTGKGGSIESPGGWSFLQDHKSLFKPYGGEASARVKYMGGRGGPFGIIQYIEGQTTEANITHDRVTVPTLLHNYYLLNGDAILSLVFQNARDIPEFQQIAFNSLVKVSPMELDLRHTH